MKNWENLVWKLLFGLVFCFLCMGMKKEEAQADVIYIPDDMFAEAHEVEEYPNGRGYTVEAGEEVNCYESPESEYITHTVASGDAVNVFYLYKNEEGVEWACIGKEMWLVTSNLKLVYDETEFRRDHAGQIKAYEGELEGYCLTYPLKIYTYPGANYVNWVLRKDMFWSWENEATYHDALIPEDIYVAEDGTIWGYISFRHYMNYKGWYCISQLPGGVVQDYDNDCLLTIQDCFIALKRALGVPQDEEVENRFVVDAVTLQDVQQMLQRVLKIG